MKPMKPQLNPVKPGKITPVTAAKIRAKVSKVMGGKC